MKSLIGMIVTMIALTACQGSKAPTAAQIENLDTTGIVGGELVTPSDPEANTVLTVTAHLQQPRIPQPLVFHCGAVALAPRIILTAAHCAPDDKLESFVELNDFHGNLVRYKVLRSVVHPRYRIQKTYDLAILLLELALPETVKILPRPSRNLDLGLREITASGTGATHGQQSVSANERSRLLRKVDLTIIDYRIGMPFFTSDQTQGKGICQGDSGGPATAEINGVTTLVGISSKTRYRATLEPDPNRCNMFGQFVNIQYFEKWIEQVMNRLSQE